MFSTPYSTNFPSIKNIFYKYLPILNKDPKLRSILEMGYKVVPRKGKTLGNMLSPSEFVEWKAHTWLFHPGFFPCNDNRCSVCKFTARRSDFVSTHDNKTYKRKQFINCNTTLVVYCIEYTACSLSYVGCTKRKLKTRISEHISKIQHRRTAISGAAKHFIDHHGASLSHFSFYGSERVNKPMRRGNWVHKLFVRETFKILHLNTRFLDGLNYRTDLFYLYWLYLI